MHYIALDIYRASKARWMSLRQFSTKNNNTKLKQLLIYIPLSDGILSSRLAGGLGELHGKALSDLLLMRPSETISTSVNG